MLCLPNKKESLVGTSSDKVKPKELWILPFSYTELGTKALEHLIGSREVIPVNFFPDDLKNLANAQFILYQNNVHIPSFILIDFGKYYVAIPNLDALSNYSYSISERKKIIKNIGEIINYVKERYSISEVHYISFIDRKEAKLQIRAVSILEASVYSCGGKVITIEVNKEGTLGNLGKLPEEIRGLLEKINGKKESLGSMYS